MSLSVGHDSYEYETFGKRNVKTTKIFAVFFRKSAKGYDTAQLAKSGLSVKLMVRPGSWTVC